MKLVVDVSVGRAVENWLIAEGWDAVTIRDLDPGMPDSDILALAVREQRLVVTMDKDFGEMVFHSRQPHAGVLLLRMADARSIEKIRTLEQILAEYQQQLAGSFAVYQNGQLRIRRGSQR